MNITCKVCKKTKPEKDFRHKHFSPTMCVECHKERRSEKYRKNPRQNSTKWMDIIIGKS